MKYLIYALCFLAIMVQLPTAADIFLHTYGLEYFGASIRNSQAFLYAVVFEFSLLIFVLQRRHWYAGLFAFFSLLTNLISHNVYPWLTAASPFLISLQLPLAIGIYSHELERLKRKEQARREAELLAEQEEEARQQALRENPPRPLMRPRRVPVDISPGPAMAAPEQPLLVTTPYKSNGHGPLPETRQQESVALASREIVAETPLPNHTCENCQKRFFAKNNTARYCSDKCRAAFHRNRDKGNESS